MAGEPRVVAAAASGVCGMISAAGGDIGRVFGAANLAVDNLDDPAALLDLNTYCTLFDEAARQTGLDSFGLRFGRSYRVETLGALGEVALRSPTLGAALQSFCRYFPAQQEHSTLRLASEDGELMRLEYQIRDGRIARRRQDAELAIATFINLFRECLGPDWSPEHVEFEHARAADPGEHRGLLGAPVDFAQPTNAVLFRRSALTVPMPAADPARLIAPEAALLNRMAGARPDNFIGRLTQEIRVGFATGDATIETIARRLGHSRTTLYRRLATKGLDFTALSQRLRQEQAELYVAQPHIPLTEIASLLGYSELSAFSRAFRRWTGISPAAFRAREARCGIDLGAV